MKSFEPKRWPDEKTEPARLDAWAAQQGAVLKSLPLGQQARRAVMITDAMRAAANLRAFRAARLRLKFNAA
jgi:hypothetical protein